MIYLGSEPRSKAYRLYDPEAGRVHVSRDVVFQEDKHQNWEEYRGMDYNMQNWFTFAVNQAGVQAIGDTDMEVADSGSSPNVPTSGTGSPAATDPHAGSHAASAY